MLRAMVLFLMLPPMLMPPGMCICQFVPDATASARLSASRDRELSASHDANDTGASLAVVANGLRLLRAR